MDYENPISWARELAEFLEPFGAHFQRSETRTSIQNYMRGLLSDIQRKNGWQLAEEVGLPDPHRLQRLLNEAKWDDGAVRRRLREKVIEQIGYDPGIGMLDESSFVKWGKNSAGVARQYCGRLGKVENCQVGVYLGYVTPTGAALLDCQLYLPQAWCDDRERCQAVKVPSAVSFQTKPQIAQAMLEQAWDEGVPMQWVVGDTLYGNSPGLREAIDDRDRYYVLSIGSHHRVQLIATKETVKLSELSSSLNNIDWEHLCCRIGEQGLLTADWQAHRVTLSGDTVGEQWLLIQATRTDNPIHRYYLSNAPADTSLTQLVAVALSRHSIEDLFGEAKGEVGMADYEVRHWHGWHRHMTLVLLAHTWLKLIQHQEREKKSFATLVECEFG